MRLIIKENSDQVAEFASKEIRKEILLQKQKKNQCILGLPTGSTPLGTYRELIQMYREGQLSFDGVTTFNMDEYVGLSPEDEQSYHYFMQENFFRHIDIDLNKTHLLDGLASEVAAECRRYEEAIREAGGIDLFLGGVGSDGHIAFNEPGSSLVSRTREKSLTRGTIADNARFFGGDLSRVPRSALTVGIGTIMDASRVVILASGENKAEAVRQAVEGSVSHMWTVTALQMHPQGMIVCDQAAARSLKASTLEYFNDVEAACSIK